MSNPREITVVIGAGAAERLLAMAKEHRFEPRDILRVGLDLAYLILDEKAQGHTVCVTDAEKKVIKVIELPKPLPEPQILAQASIDEEARNIIESAFPSSLRASIADLDPDSPSYRKANGPSSGISR